MLDGTLRDFESGGNLFIAEFVRTIEQKDFTGLVWQIADSSLQLVLKALAGNDGFGVWFMIRHVIIQYDVLAVFFPFDHSLMITRQIAGDGK